MPNSMQCCATLSTMTRRSRRRHCPRLPSHVLGTYGFSARTECFAGMRPAPKRSERLLEDRKPKLLVTDPPYGIELDSEWRDRAGLNKHGPAEASYMKHRTEGHTQTTISGDTRADWSEAFALVPSLQVAYVWHASRFTREVLDGLLRIGFLHHQQIIWSKGRAVLTRTPLLVRSTSQRGIVRKKNAPWFGKPGENSTDLGNCFA